MQKAPNIEQVRKTQKELMAFAERTPLVNGTALLAHLPREVQTLQIKPELLQKSGSFKFRGAINIIRALSEDQRKLGVTAFSGGNHAIAVAYVAKQLGISAKVVMPASADPLRVEKCRGLGAEVYLRESRSDVQTLAHTFAKEEGRILVPPFEHEKTVEATAAIGLEMITDAPDLDVVLVAIGGGGLAAGVASAIKQISKKCRVIGVQPQSADAMARSFISGRPELNVDVNTIADSLCPPQVGEYTFSVCQQFLDEVVTVDEDSIKKAMKLLFTHFRFVTEGAGAVPLAAILKDAVNVGTQSKVAFIIGGSSISVDAFERQCGSI